jgi:hypothetical protein
MAEGAPSVTQLLKAWSDGDEHALEALLPLVEAELRRLARGYMRRERRDHTLQTTALVNEAFVRLVDASATRTAAAIAHRNRNATAGVSGDGSGGAFRASSISMRASAMSCRRRFGSFSRQRFSKRTRPAGTVFGRADQSAGRSRIAVGRRDTVSPPNAARPVSIS